MVNVFMFSFRLVNQSGKLCLKVSGLDSGKSRRHMYLQIEYLFGDLTPIMKAVLHFK